MIVSNIGIVPNFSALYNSNSGMYSSTIQVALKPSHRISSFACMDRVRSAISRQYPDLLTFFSSGSMVDSVLNMGMPSPIDVQVSSTDLDAADRVAKQLADRIRQMPGVVRPTSLRTRIIRRCASTWTGCTLPNSASTRRKSSITRLRRPIPTS